MGEGRMLEFGVQEKVAMSQRVYLANNCQHLQDLLETDNPCVESHFLTTVMFFALPVGS